MTYIRGLMVAQYWILQCSNGYKHRSMVSCQKGPTRHAYAWQIGPFWQDTLEIRNWTHNKHLTARSPWVVYCEYTVLEKFYCVVYDQATAVFLGCVFYVICIFLKCLLQFVACWHHWSALALVMACRLYYTKPISHHLNPCWIVVNCTSINKLHWNSN